MVFRVQRRPRVPHRVGIYQIGIFKQNTPGARTLRPRNNGYRYKERQPRFQRVQRHLLETKLAGCRVPGHVRGGTKHTRTHKRIKQTYYDKIFSYNFFLSYHLFSTVPRNQGSSKNEESISSFIAYHSLLFNYLNNRSVRCLLNRAWAFNLT